ncbi:hypothetical protein BDY24DRAFT_417053 [Mrakia frigida]|uniref:uncharacterized protein n=1 Tax=Mrakia frigida TaxID=29902 RepID=UPI003FCC120B
MAKSTLLSTYRPPFWISVWFAASTVLVLWDAGYCFLRPRSMVGGDLHWIWAPYSLYAEVDYIYGLPSFNRGDGFTNAQSLMNILESILNLEYLYLTHPGKKVHATAPLIGFAAVVMTLSKTMLYWLQEYYCSYCNTGQNTPSRLLWLWIIPNGLWILFPLLITINLGDRISTVLRRDQNDQVANEARRAIEDAQERFDEVDDSCYRTSVGEKKVQ